MTDRKGIIDEATIALESSNVFDRITATKSKFKREKLLGLVILEKYKITRYLDTEASEAHIYLAMKDGKEYVVKVYTEPNHFTNDAISFSEKVVSKFIMQRVEPVGIVSGYQFEIFNYFKKGTLNKSENINKIAGDSDFIKYIFVEQMNEALNDLHKNGFVHGDFKLGNVYFNDDSNLILGDFGNIVSLEGNKYTYNHKRKISLPYAAQEASERLSISSDYFSFGMALLHLGDITYFQGKTDSQLRDLILTDETIINDVIKDEIAELIAMLINPSAKKRIGYTEVKKWISNKKIFKGAATERRVISKKLINPIFFNSKYINDYNEFILEFNQNWNLSLELIKSKKILKILEEIDFDKYKLETITKLLNSSDSENVKLFLTIRYLDDKLDYYWKDKNLGKNIWDIVNYLKTNDDFTDFEFIDIKIFNYLASLTIDKEHFTNYIKSIFSEFSEKKIALDMLLNLFSPEGDVFYFERNKYRGIKDFSKKLFMDNGDLNSKNPNISKLIKSNLIPDLLKDYLKHKEKEKSDTKPSLDNIYIETDLYKKALLIYILINDEMPYATIGQKFSSLKEFNNYATKMYLSNTKSKYLEDIVGNGIYRKIAEITDKNNKELFILISKLEDNFKQKKSIIPLIYFSTKQEVYQFIYDNKKFYKYSEILDYLVENYANNGNYEKYRIKKKDLDDDFVLALFRAKTEKGGK